MIVKDGIVYLAVTTLITVLLSFFISFWFLVPGIVLFIFFANFFRNPERPIPDSDCVVSPADGKVIKIKKLSVDGSEQIFLSIFMNPLDVHVNRAPIAGKITRYEYFPGKYLPAYDPQAPMENERNSFSIHNNQMTVTCSQVAGMLARRIRFWKEVNDDVAKGERIGLIKFGSRVDMWLPNYLKITVKESDRVKAGSSILALIEKKNDQ